MISDNPILLVLDPLLIKETVPQAMLLPQFLLLLIEFVHKAMEELQCHYQLKPFYHVILKETLDVKEDLFQLLSIMEKEMDMS